MWWRGRPGDGIPWRALLTALAVLLVVWAPPLAEQLTREPGNAREIVRYFRTSPEPGHSLADGWRLVAAQFTVTADWLGGAAPATTVEPASLRSSPVPILLAAFVLALWLAWRRREPLFDLAVVLALSIGLGIFSLARTLGPLYDYRLRWIWVIAALATACAVTVALRALPLGRAPTARGRTVLSALAVAGVGVLGAIGTAHALDADPPDAGLAIRSDQLVRQIRAGLPPGRGEVVLKPTSYGSYLALPGVLLRLDEAGVPTRIGLRGRQAELTFGDDRLYHSGPVRAVVAITAGPEAARAVRAEGGRRIANVAGSVGRNDHPPRRTLRNDRLGAFILPPGTNPVAGP
jgi:hypothetical protein